MARPMNLTPLPTHPAIDQSIIKNLRLYTTISPCMKVTCPLCRKGRWFPMGILRQQVQRTSYTGHCLKCNQSRPKGTKQVRDKRNPSGKRLTKNGYVILTRNAITDEELPLYNSMIVTAHALLEHRWVMGKHLGRPLRSDECIDHMDGVKTNNSIENLRIYIKGKNQPGSGSGHGTYYHEWQIALREIKLLKNQLAKRKR